MIQGSVDLELICFQSIKIPQTFTNSLCRGSFHFGGWGCRYVPSVYCCLLKGTNSKLELYNYLSIYFWTSILKSQPTKIVHPFHPDLWICLGHLCSCFVQLQPWVSCIGPWLSPSKLAVSDCLGSLFLSCVFYLVCIFGHPYWLKGVAPLQWFSATELICQGPSKVSCSSFFAPASRRPARLLIAKQL